jgi:hypothetical protein
MVIQVVPSSSDIPNPPHPPVPAPWSDQELRDFHRLQEALSRRGGMSSEIADGLGEDGDPWTVFCHAETGEVLAHFARIDGGYIGNWRDLPQIIRSRDLKPILDRFVQTACRGSIC